MSNIEDVYDLSPMQEGLLFHALYDPNSPAYFEQMSCTITGPLDVTAFQVAFAKALNRHPALRSGFYWEGLEKPTQVVHKAVDLPWTIEGWLHLDAQQQQQRLADFLKQDLAKGFQLDQPPLMRMALFQTGEGRNCFVWSHHHLLLDGWSLSLVIGEVLRFYKTRGKTPIIEPDPAPLYRDYILWLQSQDKFKAETFWKTKLSGFREATPLAFEAGRLLPQGNGELEQQLSAKTTSRLQAFAREHQLTLNTLAQAAWGLLLARCADRDEAVFGTTLSGRPTDLPHAERMVGLFINTLPVRMKLPGDLDLVTWLRQIMAGQGQLESHAYSSLAEVQAFSDVPNDQALFESLLVFENYPIDIQVASQRSELNFETFTSFEKTNYPLCLIVTPGEQLSLRLSYDCHRFEAEAAAGVLRWMAGLLELFLAQPQTKVAQIDPFGEDRTGTPALAGPESELCQDCLPALIAAQAARQPEAAAITDENGVLLTYAQLERAANQTAHRLAAEGIGPDDVVAVCLDRCSHLPVSLLGVLKSGAAYLPLDPTYPQARLNWCLEDAGVQAVITNRDIGAKLSISARLLLVEHFDQEIERNLPGRAPVHEDPAYIIYTSGSSGQPKGTVLSHGALVNYLTWAVGTYDVAGGLGAPLHGAIGFDATVTTLFAPLLAGRQLHLLPQEGELEALAQILCGESTYSFVKLTPSHLDLLRELLPPNGELSGTRSLILGGEALYGQQLSWWTRRNPKLRIFNEYGPTEAMVGCICGQVQTGRTGPVPIGKPIANTRAYLLDRQMEPVPMGIPGELYIAGAGLALGYLNRETLTAEKFVNFQGERVYQTGDLARIRWDGACEYLGRTDSQIKLRGYRIETGEIETLLTQHDGIDRAVVIFRDDPSGEGSLVAYMTAKTGEQPHHLATWLQARLPEYMIPAHLIFLETLPLTAHGKTDYTALKNLPMEKKQTSGYQAPRNPSEELLASIQAEVLGLARVGIRDHFFWQLGGHSLLATRVLSRIRESLGCNLPLRALFQHPTIAQLAKHLQRTGTSAAVPAITPLPAGTAVPLSFAQERLWFENQLRGRDVAFNIPTGLRLRGPLKAAALEKSITEMIKRHAILRTCFPQEGGRPTSAVVTGDPFSLVVETLLDMEDREREAALRKRFEEEAGVPFDLATGPLMRARLFQLGPQDHALLMVFHHMVCDDWSLHLLFGELITQYQGFCEGRLPSLEPLPIQYGDYAAWQRQYLSGSELERQLDFWQNHLTGAAPILELPRNHARPIKPSYYGGREPWRLGSGLTRGLHALCRQSDATLSMTLQTAFATLLFRYSGVPDVVLGVGTGNRSQSETENLIGPFINFLPMRHDLSGNQRFSTLLTQHRNVALDAHDHGEVPFGLIVERLQLERETQINPITQAMVVFLNAQPSGLLPKNLEVSQMEVDSGAAQLDLILFFNERGDGLDCNLYYAAELFEPGTIRLLLARFEVLLKAIVANPDRPIGQLPIMTIEEQTQRQTWNRTDEIYPKTRCLHQLFEDQVKAQGEAPALYHRDQCLSYAELNRRANQLAHFLIERGLKVGSTVGICLPKSIDMVAAVLAIHKAGCAYVPLDPAYPSARLTFMADDAQTQMVLTYRREAHLVGQEETHLVIIDECRDAIDRQPAENPLVPVSPEIRAYMIYTSGSTGNPKGPILNHQGRVNNFTDFNRRYEIGPGDRLLAVSSLSFDMSAYDISGTLAAGAALVVPEPGNERDPAHWAELMIQHQITIWHSAPALLDMLESHVAPRPHLQRWHLRLSLLGGDWIPVSLPERLWSFVPQLRFVTMGGATEVSMDSTLYEVMEVDPTWTSIPYGRPMANQTCFIVDQFGQVAAEGIAGELLLGGVGVGHGYHHRPGLTACKFVPNPFSGLPGDRLYRTGDLARYICGSKGNIELLGRMDFQVKIRGYRVELGEIESALRSHPNLVKAVVMARTDGAGVMSLAAYLVPAESKPSGGELRDFLAQSLPDYMVPRWFLFLEDLPLSPNGKIDRGNLSSLELTQETQLDTTETASDLEAIVAEIWAELLELETVTIRDNFFDLGGHSLLATRIVGRIHQDLQVEVPLSRFFATPTVAGLAQVIETQAKNHQIDLTEITNLHRELSQLSEDQLDMALTGEKH